MICDICLLVLLLLVVFRYMHRGFLSDIVNLLGSVVSIAGAMFVSHTYSEPIFDQLLRPGLEKSVMKNIAENGLDVAALAEKYGGFLPESFLQTNHSAIWPSLCRMRRSWRRCLWQHRSIMSSAMRTL